MSGLQFNYNLVDLRNSFPGWVVGGLELLGAPGALAARVGGATGGVRGVASAAAAALLRSLSAWASSLARNLDLLAGDEEHARRAAAARRRPPQSFMAGLATGITNFAINILGKVISGDVRERFNIILGYVPKVSTSFKVVSQKVSYHLAKIFLKMGR